MKKFLYAFSNVTDKLCYWMSFISMACVVLMMFLMFIDVCLSLIFNIRILGAYEVTSLALLTFVFSSWAYTQSVHGHIHVTMFINMMPQKLRFLCFGITSLISVVTMACASYAGYLAIFERMAGGDASANLLIPYWPFYVLMTVAFVFFTIILLIDMCKAFLAMFDKEVADDIQAHWA